MFAMIMRFDTASTHEELDNAIGPLLATAHGWGQDPNDGIV